MILTKTIKIQYPFILSIINKSGFVLLKPNFSSIINVLYIPRGNERISVIIVRDPKKNNPLSTVDLVIDHSVMVDNYAKKDSFLTFDKCLSFNFTNNYSKIIKKFADNDNEFKLGQKETKLNPY